MKTYKRTSLLPLTIACVLGLGTLIPSGAARAEAEATNAVPAEAVESGTTNAATAIEPSAEAGGWQPIVVFGKSVELKAGDSAEAVVVVFGSATIRGKVREAVVAVFGDIDIEGGEVGDAAVAVLGSVKAGPKSKIHGDAVAVGGTLDVDPGATVRGQKVGLVVPGMQAAWLRNWVVHCVLKLRPLALQVGWIWAVAAVLFVVYLFIAAVFQHPVQACVDELTRRPATTFFLGLLAKILMPLVLLILVATGVGALVVPFLVAALILGAIVGKIALVEALGFKLGRQFGVEALQKPLAGFLLGSLIITLLYLVWVVGLLAFLMLSVWGLGVAVAAVFGGLRRELPAKPAPVPGVNPAALAGMTTTLEPPGAVSGPISAGLADQSVASTTGMPVPATVPEAWSHPKAGFWERMAAAFLDVVLVSILGGLAHRSLLGFLGGPLAWLLLSLAYFAGMWTWKGTTVGGIVLGLKVVRVDGQPLTFVVALVRALAAMFSVVILFMGFLWIAWDSEKQGWHDRIAGTVVLRLPRGTPLVCL